MSFNVKYSLSKISIWVIAIAIALTANSHRGWKKKNKIIAWDVVSYYAYLPATFIYNDIALEKPETLKEGTFWPSETPIGKNCIKTSMGMSILYAPFFFVGHAIAKVTDYPANGFSQPYKVMLILSALFYMLLGLIFLRKILLQFFSDKVTAIVLFLCTIGTNYLYYTAYEATMPHGYNFSLFTIFIWLTIKWHKQPKFTTTLFIGLLSGLIALIRPTNALVGLIFILWDVNSWDTLKGKVTLFIKHFPLLILLVCSALLVWVPQFLYWKHVSGSFLYFSYSDNEGFFFNTPHFIRGLFGFRNGWFLYTPVMLLATLGIPSLIKKKSPLAVALPLFFIINVYIILSWWCWWYGGAYGQRPFIDSYALMAFPLAAIISDFSSKKKAIQYSFYGLLVLLLVLSPFQTKKYTYGSIHWDSMTKEAYLKAFFKLRQPANFHLLLRTPDYEKAKEGIYVSHPYGTKRYAKKLNTIDSNATETHILFDLNKVTEDNKKTISTCGKFKANTADIISNDGFSGNKSLKIGKKHPFAFLHQIHNLQKNTEVVLRVRRKGDYGYLIATYEKSDEFYLSQNVASKQLDNGWQVLELQFKVPAKLDGQTLRFYCHNPSENYSLFDDFEIFIMKQKEKTTENEHFYDLFFFE
ncbi:hypothetical protein EMN47_15090 [Prolixibacteraceae bacterium JC049]|nr:hypothetical protein [Prolixibacteraceae bacterium JC049]